MKETNKKYHQLVLIWINAPAKYQEYLQKLRPIVSRYGGMADRIFQPTSIWAEELEIPITYNALGRWLEQHQYRIVGPGRELLLQNYYPAAPEKCVMEIQFPVERLNLAEFDFI